MSIKVYRDIVFDGTPEEMQTLVALQKWAEPLPVSIRILVHEDPEKPNQFRAWIGDNAPREELFFDTSTPVEEIKKGITAAIDRSKRVEVT